MSNKDKDGEAALEFEQEIFRFLDACYVQRADGRQKAMGLQYMEVETHDLAKRMAKLFGVLKARQEPSNG